MWTDFINDCATGAYEDDAIEYAAEPSSVQESSLEQHTPTLRVPLTAEQSSALERVVQSRGVDSVSLIQEWVMANLRKAS